MLTAWDVLTREKTFLDALSDEDSVRRMSANRLVFDAALSMAEAEKGEWNVH